MKNIQVTQGSYTLSEIISEIEKKPSKKHLT